MTLKRVIARFARGFFCLGTGAAIAALAATASAHAQTYPARPIRLIVSNPAGGLPDTIARLYARQLEIQMGQPFVIENRGGGNGTIAVNSLLASPADGYTFVVTDGAIFSVNPLIQANLPYKTDDFKPAGLLAISPLFLAAHPKVGVKTFPQLVAFARANPGILNYGSSGVGSAHHIAMVAIMQALKLNATHVPFKGSGESLPALLGGHIDILFTAYTALAQPAAEKQINILATASGARSALDPNLPSIGETIPDYNYGVIIGLFAHAQTPQAVLDRVAAEVTTASKLADLTERLKTIGVEAKGTDGKEHLAALQQERQHYEPLLQAVGLTVSAR